MIDIVRPAHINVVILRRAVGQIRQQACGQAARRVLIQLTVLMRRPNHLFRVDLRRQVIALQMDSIAFLGRNKALGVHHVADAHIHDLPRFNILNGELEHRLAGGAQHFGVGQYDLVANARPVEVRRRRGGLRHGIAHIAIQIAAIALVPNLRGKADGHIARQIIILSRKRNLDLKLHAQQCVAGSIQIQVFRVPIGCGYIRSDPENIDFLDLGSIRLVMQILIFSPAGFIGVCGIVLVPISQRRCSGTRDRIQIDNRLRLLLGPRLQQLQRTLFYNLVLIIGLRRFRHSRQYAVAQARDNHHDRQDKGLHSLHCLHWFLSIYNHFPLWKSFCFFASAIKAYRDETVFLS